VCNEKFFAGAKKVARQTKMRMTSSRLIFSSAPSPRSSSISATTERNHVVAFGQDWLLFCRKEEGDRNDHSTVDASCENGGSFLFGFFILES
jgi:hypothetical protein